MKKNLVFLLFALSCLAIESQSNLTFEAKNFYENNLDEWNLYKVVILYFKICENVIMNLIKFLCTFV